MSGYFVIVSRHTRNRMEFMSDFPDNVNSENVNKQYSPFSSQAIHYFLESGNPQLKDLEYLISLGSDLNCSGGVGHQPPICILSQSRLPLRKDLIFCLLDHCPSKTILDEEIFKFESLFYRLKERDKFEHLIQFLKIILIYWFEKEQEKEKENQNEKKKEKEKKRKYKTIAIILDCLKNKENITEFKKSVENNEINLQYQDKKTNFNLLHALILSTNYDNLEAKLEIIKEIVDHKNKQKLNQKIAWVDYSELHLLSMLPVQPNFTVELTGHLIKSGSNINILDNYYLTPCYLHLQHININVDLLKFYLQNGSDIELKKKKPKFVRINRKTKPLFELFCASDCNDIEIYKLFLELGADVTTNFGTSARDVLINLVCKSKNPTLESIKLLHKSGAPIIGSGSKRKIKYYDTTIWNLLYNSECNEKYKILKYLINAGADLRLPDNYYKSNILHFLCKNCDFPKFEKCLFFLLNKTQKMNFNLNSLNYESATPLHHIMEHYTNLSLPFLKKLIHNFDGDLTLMNKYNLSPLAKYVIFTNNFNPQICNYCLNQIGNDKSLHCIDSNNKNMISTICDSVHPSIEKLKYLFENHKLNLNLVSSYLKETNLHTICRNPDCTIELINFFLKNGFDINQLNLYNQTPLFGLVEYGARTIKGYHSENLFF
ncbi:ankyrin repeat [Anaeramoeba flamelloides]|uniref:Ankyrin repeat n=1 Tax=Anaeramoeba flamelloides TaxID=1746091 RepID=A0ABQ8YGR6_9EUKA|nr:ankyrin repeat [Anaeramoeba flamelloides]